MEDYLDDPFKVLGVQKDATEREIKTAYRQLAMKHHPDRQTNDKDRALAQTIFARIAHAYEVLTDPELRREYDRAVADANSGSPIRRKPPQHFRPQFNDPYEVWKRDFRATFGMEYPGADYDWIDPSEDPIVPSSHRISSDEKSRSVTKKEGRRWFGGGKNKEPKSPNKNSQAGSTPEKAKADSPTKERSIVKRDPNHYALAESQGRNNRPIAMESTTRKEGPVTITTTTLKRPDGSTETVTTKTGIPGRKKDPDPLKMIEGPPQRKRIEGKKEHPRLSNGKKVPLLDSEAHDPSKPRLSLFRKKQAL